MSASEDFQKHLLEALEHIYDPERLRNSPLARAFGVADRYDTATALRRILSEAILELEPAMDEPSHSRTWRMFYALQYRYIEQLSQQEAAAQIAVSTRQLRRDEHVARDVLADLLWDRYGLAEGTLEVHHSGESSDSANTVNSPVDAALSWLRNAKPKECIADPSQILSSVLQIASTIAIEHNVQLETAIESGLPLAAVHPMALRQILLNLLTVVIPRANNGAIILSAAVGRWKTEIRIVCEKYPSGAKPTLETETDNLNLAIHLAQLSSCTLDLNVDIRSFAANLSLPVQAQTPILVVDDSADALALMQRYVTGTRYRLFGTGDPKQVLDLVAQFEPRIIVLDVMMPELDGWEILGLLRQHPLTSDIPIIVCTVLAQENLARLLGASAYIRKPVTQQALLTTLDDLVA